MTSSYAAFYPNMLHSPLLFRIQACRQGSVGSAWDLPTIPTTSVALTFCRRCGAHRFTTFHMGTIHGLGPASPPVIVLSASGELLTPEPITYLLVKLVSIFSLLSMTTFISGSCSISHTMLRPSS